MKAPSEIVDASKPAAEDRRNWVIEPEEPRTTLLSLFSRSEKKNPDGIATQPSVYDNPAQAVHYQPHPEYENLHRFDPSFRWTWDEENVSFRRSNCAAQANTPLSAACS